MDILQGTIISAHELKADDLLDRLIESCGEVAVLNYVQRKAWYPPSDPPDDRSVVLVTVRYRDVRSRPYVIKAQFDHDRGGWRTPSGMLGRDLEVVGWTWMPEPKGSDR